MNRKTVAALLAARTHGLHDSETRYFLKKAGLLAWDPGRCECVWTDAGNAAMSRLEVELGGVPVDAQLLMGCTSDPWTRAMLSGARASRTGVIVRGCIIDGAQWATDGYMLVRIDCEPTAAYEEMIPDRHVRRVLSGIDPTATPVNVDTVVLVNSVSDFIRGDKHGLYGPIYVAEVRGRRFQYGVVRTLLRYFAGGVLVPGADNRIGVICGGDVVAVVPALEECGVASTETYGRARGTCHE